MGATKRGFEGGPGGVVHGAAHPENLCLFGMCGSHCCNNHRHGTLHKSVAQDPDVGRIVSMVKRT